VLAAVDYCDTARDLALKLKYGRKPGVADVMAALMVRHARRYPDAILVPIPLHRWRIWQRGFNQSLLIARSVTRLTGQQVLPSPILRTKRTSPLGGLSRTARSREVRGAFKMDLAHIGSIKGRQVLLVDDVYTTGATTNACADVLKRAGAETVHILCWARVLKEDR
jgi:ComF family protein